MQRVNTKLTTLLNIKTPILAAPMAFASTPELAASVTAAGGFGLFGAGFDTPEQHSETIRLVREQLNIQKGAPVPVAFGFIGWILDMTEASPEPRLEKYLEEKPTGIWFAFGTDLGKYIRQVQEYDAKRDHKTLIFVIVNSAADALKAANEWKVDVVVIQGQEAGGHGGDSSPPLFSLIQDAVTTLRKQGPANGPAIVAAGGVSTGEQIAALLTIGADGVALGTRFLFTNECKYTPAMKQVLIDAHFGSTKRGNCYDQVFGTDYWPAGHDGRAIANEIWNDQAKGLPLEKRKELYAESEKGGSTDRLVIWAGVAAGMTSEVKPAAAVVNELHEGLVGALRSASNLLRA